MIYSNVVMVPYGLNLEGCGVIDSRYVHKNTVISNVKKQVQYSGYPVKFKSNRGDYKT